MATAVASVQTHTIRILYIFFYNIKFTSIALAEKGPSALPALSVSGPGALCVGPWHFLCRGPALSVSGPGALPALSLSGPGALWSGLGALCVAARRSLCPGRSLCWAPALSVSDPVSVWRTPRRERNCWLEFEPRNSTRYCYHLPALPFRDRRRGPGQPAAMRSREG